VEHHALLLIDILEAFSDFRIDIAGDVVEHLDDNDF
jgi:hypothetical protein